MNKYFTKAEIENSQTKNLLVCFRSLLGEPFEQAILELAFD